MPLIVQYVIALPLFALIGCSAVPWIDKTQYNKLVTSTNEMHKEDMQNQIGIARQVLGINNDLLSMAKKEQNMNLIIARAKRVGASESILKEAGVIAKLESNPIAESAFGFMSMLDGLIGMIANNPIITSLLSASGLGMVTMGAKAIHATKTNKRLKSKARKYAKSTEVNSIEDDEDLA